VRFEANIEDTITILGAPTLKLWVVPSKSEFQANVFFYDVDQKGGSELIGHTTYTKRNAKPGEEQLVTFDTNVISHQLKGGHKFRIVITTADILWVMPLSNNFDLDILYEPEHASSITLPLIEAPEAPSDSEILPSLMSYPTYFILGILSLAYPLIFAGITALDITMMIWPTLQLIIGPLLEGLLGVVWVFTAPIFTLLLQPEVIDLLGSLVGLAVEVLAPIIQVTYVLLESLLELMGKPPYP
jgi:hypothetical protein